jgi:hypothetical protein
VPVNYSANATPAASTATSDDYQNAISGQIKQLSQPTDPNSAVVRSQTDAYNIQSNRDQAAARNAAAQSAYASGDMSGAPRAAERIAENAAAGRATNTAGVMATAEAQRQANLNAMMGLGTSAALQQQGITNQAGQFGDQLALNYAQLGEAHNAGAANLGERASEFGTTADLQRQAMLQAMKIAQMNDATSRYGIQTGADTSRYNTDTNYNLGEDNLFGSLLRS